MDQICTLRCAPTGFDMKSSKLFSHFMMPKYSFALVLVKVTKKEFDQLHITLDNRQQYCTIIIPFK